MARNRFHDIKRYLQFDDRRTRQARLQGDKFALISLVFNKVVENFQKAYGPDFSLCIDEQLFPTKAKCPVYTVHTKQARQIWHQVLGISGCKHQILSVGKAISQAKTNQGWNVSEAML